MGIKKQSRKISELLFPSSVVTCVIWKSWISFRSPTSVNILTLIIIHQTLPASIRNLKSFQGLHFPQITRSLFDAFPWNFMYIYIMSSRAYDFPFRFPSKRLAQYMSISIMRGSGKCFLYFILCTCLLFFSFFPRRFGCSWKEMKNWMYLYEWEKWRQIESIQWANLTIGYLRTSTYLSIGLALMKKIKLRNHLICRSACLNAVILIYIYK